jgi:hypothetical protein
MHVARRSAFYPQRANRFTASVEWLKRTVKSMRHESAPLPERVSFVEFIVSVLVPGFGFWFRRRGIAGVLALSASAILSLMFLIWLGRPTANIAFGLLMSLHSSGLLYLCEPWLAHRSRLYRVWASFAGMGLLALALDIPARSYFQNQWFMPLQVKGQVVIVKVDRSLPRRAGEWMAYSLAGKYDNHVLLQGGYGLRPVWGLAGEQVVFTGNSCGVEGRQYPRMTHMPSDGSEVVPKGRFFAWPEFDISGHGAVTESDIAQMLVRISMVPQENIIGRPFRRWFWFKQELE